ncbi:MAG TPA: PIN domain-containing protein [Gemmatimonadales bacterium]|nr:PIN domain-containing protein [Gemmatimonadales bacterium]
MVVLDSSFLIAFHNTRDAHHAAAARAMLRLQGGEWGQALLLEYVFLEVMTVLLARRGLSVAAEVGGQLLRAREVEFVPCSDFFFETLRTFRDQPQAKLSFADAAIVTVARRQPPGLVATFDADFSGIQGVTVVSA